ncbi:hypothetical protein BER30_004110 [Clostridioides difficile]|nr:hypothetical protein [Clostridioides difficile]OMK23257.1 hypothetical protein BER30_004110 [Clostridioides difficile]
MVQVESPKSVILCSELLESGKRDIYIESRALLPHVNFDCSLDAEQFNVMLQSSFVDTEDKKLLFKSKRKCKRNKCKNCAR